MKFHEFGESSSWPSLCAHACQSGWIKSEYAMSQYCASVSVIFVRHRMDNTAVQAKPTYCPQLKHVNTLKIPSHLLITHSFETPWRKPFSRYSLKNFYWHCWITHTDNSHLMVTTRTKEQQKQMSFNRQFMKGAAPKILPTPHAVSQFTRAFLPILVSGSAVLGCVGLKSWNVSTQYVHGIVLAGSDKAKFYRQVLIGKLQV